MMMAGDSRSRLPARFWGTTVGKKIVMALTGAIGVGYVVAHMLGNLQVFARAEKINAYAALLKSNPALLLTARSILIVGVIPHLICA